MLANITGPVVRAENAPTLKIWLKRNCLISG